MRTTGRIDDDGKLIILNRKVLDDWVKQHPGKNIEIEIRLKRKQRTQLQNAYYHAVVVKMVCQRLLDLGNEVDEADTHAMLKKKFNSIPVANAHGEVEYMPRSTTEMDTTDMMEYVAKIQRWSAEFLELYIPDPNEQLKIDIK